MISLHFSRFHFSRPVFGLVILSTAALAAEPSPDLEQLLLRMERQIVAGHTATPPEDNAVATWQQVVELGSGGIDSPATHGALATFSNHLRTRAIDEMAAGRKNLADDLAIFAVQASHLAWRVPFQEALINRPTASPITEPTEQPQINVAVLEPKTSTAILVEHAKPITQEKRRRSVHHDQPQRRDVQFVMSTTPPPTPNFVQRLFMNIGGLFHRQPRQDNLKAFY
jgi:hypothetical protein